MNLKLYSANFDYKVKFSEKKICVPWTALGSKKLSVNINITVLGLINKYNVSKCELHQIKALQICRPVSKHFISFFLLIFLLYFLLNL